ncbi:Transcription factor, K-box [Dillenia turbinata]|uniref:Transcription factor, K-box n=1 Tax=Dillenia turbinata TaxID=194707 RepID=A0AAN8WET3_9MAGN
MRSFESPCFIHINSHNPLSIILLLHVTKVLALEANDPEISALKEHIEKLQLEGRQMSGEDIDVLSMEELHELEQQISKGIKSVKERKEQLLYEQLQKSQEKEQKVVEENEALQKQVEELQQRTAITEIPRKKRRSAASCPKTPTNGDENSAMHLGLLADVCCRNEDEV